MPDTNPDPGPYAEALVALGEALGDLPRAERQVVEAASLIEQSEELRRFLGSPAVSDEGKQAALRQALQDRIEPALLHFLVILWVQGLFPRLREFATEFLRLASQRRRRAAGVLITAHPLAEDVVARIENEVGAVLGQDVSLWVQEDPSLLGGVRVQVGDFVLDGTVEARLDAARRALLA